MKKRPAKGSKIFLKYKNDGTILKTEVEVKFHRKDECYIVGNYFGFWIDYKNTSKDPLWLVTK